ncbi:MAG: hypothetical protein R2748_16915 [Bryobacterales bacterium]
MNGDSWPVLDREAVWLPAGRHTVSPDETLPPGRVLRLNATLESAETRERSAIIRYRSSSVAYALLDRKPEQVFLDREPFAVPPEQAPTHWLIALPRGAHEAEFRF